MGDMRKIRTLPTYFRRVVGDETLTATDLFHRKRFDDLQQALKWMAAKDSDDHKLGLKLSLGYLLKKAECMLTAQRIINGELTKLRRWNISCVLKLHWDGISW